MYRDLALRARRDHVPVEVQDEVELWARDQGRHARIVWLPQMGCACVEIDLRPGDPRLGAWQEGRLKHEPKERVYLHRYDKAKRCWVGVPSTPSELTPDHVRGWLDRGNLWSGRGEHRARNIHEACVAADERNEEHRKAIRREVEANTRDRARDRRRQALGLPLVAVPDKVS